jgi:hypothetical protein
MVFPRDRLGNPPHVQMPEGVRELYEEAAQVAVVSRRAGAALARATVERLLKYLDPEAPKGATLDKRIERVTPRVSTSARTLLEMVRVSGNGAVHADDEPDEIVTIVLSDQEGPSVLEMLLDAANDLVDELIARPAQIEQRRAQLPQHVQDKLQGSPDQT